MLQGTQRAQPTCINVPLPPRLAPSSRVVLAVCQPTPTTQRETPWFDPGNNCGRTKRSQKIDTTRSVSMFRCSDVPDVHRTPSLVTRWETANRDENTHRFVDMYRRQLLHQRHLIMREQRDIEGYQDVRLY